MITEKIAEIAVQCLDKTHYYGAGFLMALESMIAPIPSEAVMPFVGFQVADGKWTLCLAILATSIGSIIGSLISYLMGYYGGRPLVLHVGKYLLLDEEDLHTAERFFHRKTGTWTLFVSRFVPVIRHVVSIPAGLGKMPMVPFLLATFCGATLWNTFLLFCGMRLRQKWEVLMKYSHQIDIGVVIVIVAAVAWFVHHKFIARKHPTPPAQPRAAV